MRYAVAILAAALLWAAVLPGGTTPAAAQTWATGTPSPTPACVAGSLAGGVDTWIYATVSQGFVVVAPVGAGSSPYVYIEGRGPNGYTPLFSTGLAPGASFTPAGLGVGEGWFLLRVMDASSFTVNWCGAQVRGAIAPPTLTPSGPTTTPTVTRTPTATPTLLPTPAPFGANIPGALAAAGDTMTTQSAGAGLYPLGVMLLSIGMWLLWRFVTKRRVR
jgi:hypothetical protein